MDKLPLAELWEAVQEHGGYRPAGRALGIPESTIRVRLKDYTPVVPAHAFVPSDDHLPDSHIEEEGVPTVNRWEPGVTRRFILTSAQNNARVHEGFLHNLKALAADVDADIHVSFTLYDRTGYRGLVRERSSERSEVWWDRTIKEYACNNRLRLHKRLAFCGELDVLATARKPLTGLDSYCGRSSVIVPHNAFAFKCVESRPHQMPKELFTTGSVTKSRFIQRKAGQIAHFHHVIGALLVEVTGDGYWHVHHLNAEEDGSFYWLNKRVENGEVFEHGQPIPGLILGDIHAEKVGASQLAVVAKIMQDLVPQTMLIHDLIDFTSRNHHNRGNPIFKIKHMKSSVETDMARAANVLARLYDDHPDPMVDIVVAASNHDSAFTKWLRETDWRDDPTNALYYLQAATAMVDAAVNDQPFNGLQWAMTKANYLGTKPVRYLKLDESFEIEGIECGIHGHVGPSGLRGTPQAFSRLGFKTFTGHTHSPSIIDGCYTVGVTGRLNMGYNVGPSKWMHCHGVIYPNGKRALLFVKNGKYRA